MFIEQIKVDFSGRKEKIEQISHNISLQIQRYHFEIKKAVHDRENNILYLYNVNWLNPNNFEKEDSVIELINENLDILIYDYLLN